MLFRRHKKSFLDDIVKVKFWIFEIFPEKVLVAYNSQNIVYIFIVDRQAGESFGQKDVLDRFYILIYVH